MNDGNADYLMQKILIVEDEPDVAELVAFNLSRAGYATVIAHDGLSGLESYSLSLKGPGTCR